MRILRILLVVAALSLLFYGIFAEFHDVRGLDGSGSRRISGADFAEGSTYESYMLQNGELRDTQSLQPEPAQVKECKT